MDLFQLHSRSDSGADLDSAWLERLYTTQYYPCRHRRPEYQHTAITPQMAEPRFDGVIDGHPGVCTIVRCDLVAVLSEFITSDILLADVVNRLGIVDSGSSALTIARPLPLRGGPDSVRRTCPACGSFMYFPMPMGQEYVLREYLRPNTELYMQFETGLIVTGHVLGAVPRPLRRLLRVNPVAIRDEPLDGIADFPAP